MRKFEELYIGYNENLEKFATGLVAGDAFDYNELKEAAFPVYSAITDKEKWLNQELLSLVDDTKIDIPFSEDFKIFYKNGLLRFELIASFLAEKNIIYNISHTLNNVADYHILKNEFYKVIRIIAELMLHSEKTNISFDIIDKILHSYYSDTDFEDRTILFNLSIYLRENFSHEDRAFLNDKYPDFNSY